MLGLTSGVTAVAAAVGDFGCAIADGGVKCWGNNTHGQLGNGTSVSSTIPVQVQGLTSGVSGIAVGNYVACAIVEGEVQCWGNADNVLTIVYDVGIHSSIPVPITGLTSEVTAVSAGAGSECAIVGNAAWCWGLNYHGEVGIGSGTVPTPVPVPRLTSGVAAISVGAIHACVVVNGAAQCWGYDSRGLELGDGTRNNSATPVQVKGLTSGVSAISAGAYLTCAIVEGRAQCWGENTFGQLGDGTTTDSAVPVGVVGL